MTIHISYFVTITLTIITITIITLTVIIITLVGVILTKTIIDATITDTNSGVCISDCISWLAHDRIRIESRLKKDMDKKERG